MVLFLRNKTILITGGTGTIGSALLRQSLKQNPKEIRIFSRDEMKQYDMMTEYETFNNVKFLIGDVANKESIYEACKNVQIIFHTAALKQVPITEIFPGEAIRINVNGTKNVINTAIEQGVEKVINISTDKAVQPTSVLGATKLLSEKLITSASVHNKKPVFASVRFGNVLGSRGSLIPKIEKQITLRKKITITNPNMTRFIMSIDQAAKLVINTAQIAKGGEIFVLKMNSVKISDYVKAAVNEIIKENRIPINKLKIKTIGKRSGEKTHERLLDSEEVEYAKEFGNYIIIKSPSLQKTKSKINPKWISSETAPRLYVKDITKLISSFYKK